LKLKLTIQVSPRTVGKYLRRDRPVRTPDPKQRWSTFVRNHSKVIVACDFFVVITAAFRTEQPWSLLIHLTLSNRSHSRLEQSLVVC
jgi:putative transposase